MEDVIVRQVIHGQKPDGTNVDIIIEIGAPYPYGQNAYEWVCRLEAPSLDRSNHKAHGEGALQALCLALLSVRMGLDQFREAGGKLGHELGHDDYDINSAFGLTDLARKH